MKKIVILFFTCFLAITISSCSLGILGIIGHSIQMAVFESISIATNDLVSDIIEETTKQVVDEALRETMTEINSDSLQKITSQATGEAMADISYSDYDLTKNQKIEVWSSNKKQLLRTISSNYEIIDYIKHEEIEQWKPSNILPKGSKALYHFIYFQESKNSGDLTTTASDTLYKTIDNKYFIHSQIIDKSIPLSDFTYITEIPEKTAVFLIGVAKGNEILPYNE